MLVRINGLPLIDEQEKLFQEVKESFARLIVEYQKNHRFKELICDFTNGENLINIDQIKARLWYWKLVLMLKALRISLKVAPPSEEQAEVMIVALEELNERLGVE